MCHKGGTNHETYNNYIIFLLYVGYMLISWPNMQEINKLKEQLSKQFAMKTLVLQSKFLGRGYYGKNNLYYEVFTCEAC